MNTPSEKQPGGSWIFPFCLLTIIVIAIILKIENRPPQPPITAMAAGTRGQFLRAAGTVTYIPAEQESEIEKDDRFKRELDKLISQQFEIGATTGGALQAIGVEMGSQRWFQAVHDCCQIINTGGQPLSPEKIEAVKQYMEKLAHEHRPL